MRSILEELFYGNVCPCTNYASANTETEKLMGYLAAHHKTLREELTDKQKETLEKFDECQFELTAIREREMFLYAFKLGMRIAIDVLAPDDEN